MPDHASKGVIRVSSRRDSSTGYDPDYIYIPPIVTAPVETHRLTIIFLHDRGPDGHPFHDALLAKKLPPLTRQHSMDYALRHARLVFPPAPIPRPPISRHVSLHVWHPEPCEWPASTTDGGGRLFRVGLAYVHELIRVEIARLDGDAGQVIVAGFGAGCSMALSALLLWQGSPLGGAIGLCGTLAWAEHLVNLLNGQFVQDSSDDARFMFPLESQVIDATERDKMTAGYWPSQVNEALEKVRTEARLPPASSSPTSEPPFSSTPLFMAHGQADRNMPVVSARKTAELMRKVGVKVQWKGYAGVRHTYSAEMLADMLVFLDDKVGL